MPAQSFQITDGPDKPALQWALAYPERQNVHFGTQSGGLYARVTHLDELADGFTFQITGTATSEPYQGRAFTATYDVGSQSGTLVLE